MQIHKSVSIALAVALTFGVASAANAQSFSRFADETVMSSSVIAESGGSTPPPQVPDFTPKKPTGVPIPIQIIKVPIEHVSKNVKGAGRESGAGAKVLKGVTGISVKSIEENGILGGDNSEANKIRRFFGF